MAISEEQKKFFSQNFTIPCRILHPKLLVAVAREAKPGETQKKPQFGVMAVWPKQSADPRVMQATANIKQFLDAAFNAYHQGINKQVLIDPLKDDLTYLRTDGRTIAEALPYCVGSHWMNCNSGEAFKPTVVDKNSQQVLAESQIYSGMNALVNVSFYNMDGATGGKRGIGVNINAVMLQDGGEQLVGAHTPDINAIFGSFQADMGIAPQPVAQHPNAPAPQASVNPNAQGFHQPPVAQPLPTGQPVAPAYAPQPVPMPQVANPAPAAQPLPAGQPFQQPVQPGQVANPFAPPTNQYV